MARRTSQTEEFVDDLDGTPADGTVRFGFEGQSYEIDLSRANKRALENLIKPYVERARKVGLTGSARQGRGSRRTRTSSSGAGQDLAAIREWARGQGFVVSDRGRIAREIVDAYESAQVLSDTAPGGNDTGPRARPKYIRSRR